MIIITLTDLLSALSLFVVLLSAAYKLGGHRMAVKNGREIIRIESDWKIKYIDLEQKHREELNNKDRAIREMNTEIDQWREKYFRLLEKHKVNGDDST